MPVTPWYSIPVSPGERRPLSGNERWCPVAYKNNRFLVQLSIANTPLGDVVHLWIRQHDGQMPRSWKALQQIKNDLVGSERVGVEVFPPTSQLVDRQNLAHLWVYPEGFALPFTLYRDDDDDWSDEADATDESEAR